MTRREQILATTLVVLMGVGGSLFLFHLFVYEPMTTVRNQLNLAQEQLLKKQAELAQEERQIKQVLEINPRLSQWQKISLPPRDPEAKKAVGSAEHLKAKHLAHLRVEYGSYLHDLMRSSGFRNDTIGIQEKPIDRRASPTVAKGKEPPVERFAFELSAKGTLENVVRLMQKFHKDPLLHQIRQVKLALPETTTSTTGPGSRRGNSSSQETLNVNMTVEAMMVQGAEERSTLPPKSISYPPRVLAEPARDYLAMAKRNMFTGIAPPAPTVDERPTRQTEDRADVLRFIKLTTLFYNPDRNRWEATIYDQASGPRRIEEQDEDGNTIVKVIWEKQLNTRILRELKVQDRYRNTILDAEVVHIDEQQLIFKAGKQFFRLRCGDALYPAIEKPLDKAEVKELGLDEE